MLLQLLRLQLLPCCRCVGCNAAAPARALDLALALAPTQLKLRLRLRLQLRLRLRLWFHLRRFRLQTGWVTPPNLYAVTGVAEQYEGTNLGLQKTIQHHYTFE